MPMVVAFVVALATVPLGGGRLGALADVRLRRWWLLAAGMGLQLLSLTGVPNALGAVLHGASYAAGGAYLFSNLHLPGILWVGVGAALNLLGIAANGGTLPASASALRVAGIDDARGDEFVNSAAIADARLPFLGDIFAIPDFLPFSNVFSIGDVVLAIGIFIALHRLTGSRFIRPSEGRVLSLTEQPRARSLWIAQCITWTASWAFAGAVIVLTVGRPGALASVVSLALCGFGAALLLGGPLIDRFNAPALLACAAFGQACAAGVLLIAPRPGLLGPAAVLIGFLAGLARPAVFVLLVETTGPPRRLISAVGLLEASLVAIGMVLAGLPVRDLLAVGARPVLGVATLLWGVAALAWSVMPASRRPAPPGATLWRDLLSAVRSVEDTPVLARLALLMATLGGGIGLASVDPFVAVALTWRRATPIGLTAGCLAVGVGLGALAATSIRRRAAAALGPSAFAAGLGLFVGAAGGSAMWGLAGWLIGGMGVGVTSAILICLALTLSPPLLQGRVLALGFGAVLVGLGTGYTIGGSLREAGGPVAAGAAAGAVLVAAGVVAAAMARSGSVAESGIHQSDELLAGRESADVLLEQPEEPSVRLTDHRVGDVGGDEAVVEIPEGVTLREGLRIGDVEAGRPEAAVAQNLDEVVGHDVGAPGHVDEMAPLPHGQHLLASDDSPGLGSEGEGDDHEVRPLDRGQEPVGSDGPCRTCQWLGISADDCCLHGEGPELVEKGGGDPAGSQDRDPRAVESASR